MTVSGGGNLLAMFSMDDNMPGNFTRNKLAPATRVVRDHVVCIKLSCQIRWGKFEVNNERGE